MGCRSTRPLAEVAGHVTRDTIYVSNLHYDSVFVSHDRTTDYHLNPRNPLNPLKPSETDTVFIHDRTVEYHYRLLRDTVYRVKIDSIPVIREVEVIREVKYVPFWNKLLAALSGALLLISALWLTKKFII